MSDQLLEERPGDEVAGDAGDAAATGVHRLVKHPLPQRVVHWFNATCFLLLWLTGIAIITNSGYQIGPRFYVDAMNSLVGGPQHLLRIHVYLGIGWFGILAVSFVLDPHGLSMRFLRDLKPSSNDLAWLKARLGAELAGDTGSLPAQGAYNAGQKLFGVTALLGSIVIATSGLAMWFGLVGGWLARSLVLIHLVTVGVVIAFFFVHLAMAAFLKEERPALKSMVHGDVDPGYAHHHHADWIAEHGDDGEPLDRRQRFALPRAVAALVRRPIERAHRAQARPLSSPYVAGFGLGLVVLAGFVILGHGPGSSGFFSRLGAVVAGEVDRDWVESNAYWSSALDEPLTSYWLTWTVAGIALGGLVSALLARRIAFGIDRGSLVSRRARLAMALGGGVVVGIATRLARGCTSHHLSEGALLSVGSWVFLLSVFVGGFTAAFLFKKVWR
ncbi:MAG: cytochrome b/b6 domain-containing protein [Ilumatobacteraceae bacterium]